MDPLKNCLCEITFKDTTAKDESDTKTKLECIRAWRLLCDQSGKENTVVSRLKILSPWGYYETTRSMSTSKAAETVWSFGEDPSKVPINGYRKESKNSEWHERYCE